MGRRSALAIVVVFALSCQGDDGPEADGESSTGDATADPSTTAPSSTSTASSTVTATSAGATSDPTGDPTGDPTADSTGDATDASDEGGAPVGCYDYDAFVPSPVSFRADVMPIFAAACSQCHSDASASVYFGVGGTSEEEAVAVFAKLLSGEPKQAPHLAFVEPGDPLHSYMLAKVEYANPGGTCSEVQCAEPGCELPAPPAGPLGEADKGILRSWILGGALDD
jgi:hypothetical protein